MRAVTGPKRFVVPHGEGEFTMMDSELAFIESELERIPGALGPILEIGVFHGRTTSLMAQFGPVVAVDSFRGNLELAPFYRRPHTGWNPNLQLERLYRNLSDPRLPTDVRANVVLVRGFSHKVLPELRHTKFRLVLLDADKREASVLRDLRLIWPMLSPGGTLLVDDWYSNTPREPRGSVERAWVWYAGRQGLSDLEPLKVGVTPDGTVKLVAIRKPA